ncbi:hypothetical protein Fmac_017301 [Flemingia macrophylla]|uniref:Uncharacterized protein n=1 Tax=Flemingia macrophylla TaxID=520843 RepID=A0ABD1M3L4_9FABA
MSGGGKESQGEFDRVKDTEEVTADSKASHSHSVGITNENCGSIHLEQSLKGVERRDGDGGDSAGAFANDMAMSEEVNGTVWRRMMVSIGVNPMGEMLGILLFKINE